MNPSSHPQPIEEQKRHGLIDALRGWALFGVLVVNMLWFATGGGALPSSGEGWSPTAATDRWVERALQFFIYAKANTIFTFLFGISFSLQFERVRQQMARVDMVIVRRLGALLLIGIVHLFGAWLGDILHVYALAGFALLWVRRWSDTSLTVVGMLLILIVERILAHHAYWIAWLGFGTMIPVPDTMAMAAIQTQLLQLQSGGYLQIVELQWSMMSASGYFGFGLAVWLVYSIGRFMLGIVVARRGYLFAPAAHTRTLRLAALTGLAVGAVLTAAPAVLAYLARLLASDDLAIGADLAAPLLPFASLLMSIGYLAGAALLWLRPRWRRLLAVSSPVGKTALTNYLLQTVFNLTIFFGTGLGQAGRLGASACLLLALVFFATQIVSSAIWLRHFRYGPLEWLWRWWSYGNRPCLRR